MLSDRSQLISLIICVLTDLRQKQPHASAGQESLVYWGGNCWRCGTASSELLVQEAWNPMMVMMQLWGRLAGYQGVIESLILADPPSFQNRNA